MAKLPPKAPTTQNWPPFAHQTDSIPTYHNRNTNQNHNIVCTNEFLDLSSAHGSSHRRAVSDSFAFLDNLSPAAIEACLDQDQQLTCMFSDHASAVVAVGSLPSTRRSDRNSNDEHVAAALAHHEVGEVEESSREADHQPAAQPDSAAPCGRGGVSGSDPKRVKRILANRKSAQRSRVRKLHYISQLELSVSSLQMEVSTLSPRVAFLDHQRLILNMDNSTLKQRIAALAQDKLFKDAYQEALKKEIERLREVYHHQNLTKKMNGDNPNNNGLVTVPPPRLPHSPSSDTMICADKQCPVN